MPARDNPWAIYDVFTVAGRRADLPRARSATRSGSSSAMRWASPTSRPTRRYATNNQRVVLRPQLLADAARAAREPQRRRARRRSMERAGLPFAPIRKPEDLYDDPHLNATGGLRGRPPARWRQRRGRRSRRRCFRSRWRARASACGLDPPRLGAHTRALLSALGVRRASEIDAPLPATRGGLTERRQRLEKRDVVHFLALADAPSSPPSRRSAPASRSRCRSRRSFAQVGEKAVRIVLPECHRLRRRHDHAHRAAGARQSARASRSWSRTSRAPAASSASRRSTRAAPDGMTLCVVSNNVVIFPSVLQDAAVRAAGRHHADRDRRLHADRAGRESRRWRPTTRRS